MWIYSNAENTWVNTDKCLRLFRDGGVGWGFKSEDGQVTHITEDEYDKAKDFFSKRCGKPDRKDTIEELRKKLEELDRD